MDPVKTPDRITAQWCALRPQIMEEGAWFVARRNFQADRNIRSAHLWIASGGAYQLFINARLAGAGPRPHHLPDTCYADCWDAHKYISGGENTLGVVFRMSGLELPRHPGFWCQLEIDGRTVLESDGDWDIFEVGRGLVMPKALAEGENLSITIDREYLPVNWCSPDAVAGERWKKADWLRPVTAPGGKVVFHPLSPGDLADDPVLAMPGGCGTFERKSAVLACDFASIYTVPGVYLAGSFHYEEKKCRVKMIFSCDGGFVLYCNNRCAASGPGADCMELELDMRGGWNRILVYVEADRGFAGIFCRFPERPADENFCLVDSLENAFPGWNVFGPLRLSLERAAAGIRLENLNVSQCRRQSYTTCKNAAWVRNLEFNSRIVSRMDSEIITGGYVVYRFDRLRYGMLELEFTASAGSIVDIASGSSLNPFGVPVNEGGRLSVYSVRAGSGVNRLWTGISDAFLYVMVMVRHSDEPVKITKVAIYERLRMEAREAEFKCSDPELNRVWEVGLNTIRRGAVFQPPPWQDFRGARLFDQYVQSFNMLAVFGDWEYSGGRLADILASQLESGELAVAVHSRKLPRQIEQLFALPLWLAHHYVFTGDAEILRQGAEAIEKLLAFFHGFLDEDRKLILMPPPSAGFGDLFGREPLPEGSIPVVLNAQLGRLLLSAGGIFRFLGRQRDAERCFREAVLLSDRLKKAACDKKTGLLPRGVLPDGKAVDPGDLQANFTALFAGILDTGRFQDIFYKFFNFTEPFAKFPRQSGDNCFNFFFMEMLFSLNQGNWALRYMRDFFSSRLNENADAWQDGADEFADLPDAALCGGRLIAPNAFLLREASGIRSTEPGYRSVYFKPPLDVLDYARVRIPAVSGEITVSWRKKFANGESRGEGQALEVAIDANFPLTVYPDLPQEILDVTTFDVCDLVSVEPMPSEGNPGGKA